MKPYPISLHSEIITAYKNHEGSMSKLACRFRVSRSFVQKVINKEKKAGNYQPSNEESKISLLLFYQDTIQNTMEEKPYASLKELCFLVKQRTGIEVSQTTMWRFLRRINR